VGDKFKTSDGRTVTVGDHAGFRAERRQVPSRDVQAALDQPGVPGKDKETGEDRVNYYDPSSKTLVGTTPSTVPKGNADTITTVVQGSGVKPPKPPPNQAPQK
jgi:hypothetical protein